MDNKKSNWFIGVIIAIIIIVLLILFLNNRNSGSHNNHESESSSTNNAEVTNQDTNNTEVTSVEVTNQDTSNTTQNTDSLENYISEQDTIMSKMMKNMEAVSNTGNASIDFLKGMIPHHEAAIEMAESYLKYGGENQELKKLAEDIINVQTQEIQDMNTMITKIQDSGHKDEEKETNYLKEYDTMMSSHQHEEHSNNETPINVEQAFAEGMIVHHQMAIDMAQSIIKYTDEEDVRLLAQKIIDAQENEITQMQNIINELKKSS